METSLRYSPDSKSLRIHAKENLPLHSNTFLQVHGALDTKFGGPSYCLMLRHFYPNASAIFGLGLHIDKHGKIRYSVRGKKAFPVSSDGLKSVKVKGHCDVDNEFKERKSKGAVEFSWSNLNLREDQDVRFRVGYEFFEKVPYFQIRENNWTLNADSKGRWNIRYDL